MENWIDKEILKSSVEKLQLSGEAKRRIMRACSGRKHTAFFTIRRWEIGVVSLLLCIGIFCFPVTAKYIQGFTAVIKGTVLKTAEEANLTKDDNLMELEFPGRGFAYDACPWLDGQNNRITDEDMNKQITEITKLKLMANIGSLYLEGESEWIEDQELVSKEKTTLPEIKVTDLPYTASWNGAGGVYFPNTYYPEGNFTAMADCSYRIKIYAMDGAYAATITPVLNDGSYVADVAVDGGDYYIVLFCSGGESTSGVTFTIQ